MTMKLGMLRLVNKLAVKIGAILILAVLILSANVAPAFACAAQPRPSDYPQYTLKERVDKVDYVFSGTITNIQYGDTAVATVTVQKYYKGGGYQTVKIRGFSSGADCQETVQVGQQAVFFVFGDPASGFRVTSTLNTQNYVDPTEKITDPFLAELVQTIGHQPSYPFTEDVITPGPTVKNTPVTAKGPASGINLEATGEVLGVIVWAFVIVMILGGRMFF